jgi:hypothetical protein
MESGRTRPLLMGCERSDGVEIELVVKLKAACDMKTRSLMNEAIGAMFAADLGLPVPEPFLVRIDSNFAGSLEDADLRNLAMQSVGLNYGSKKLTGYSIFPFGLRMSGSGLVLAAEILAFDVFIENPDRRIENPNILHDGKDFAIYDHELAFGFDFILGWTPPWKRVGGGHFPIEKHVLYGAVRNKPISLDRLENSLKSLTDSRLQEYGQALPDEWIGEGIEVSAVLEYIAELRNNATNAIEWLTGVLR